MPAKFDLQKAIAGEIAAGIEAALKSGAMIKSRVYAGSEQMAANELACWAEEYSDQYTWLRMVLGGVPLAELQSKMADAYAESFAEAEFDAECERNETEAADDRSREGW